MSQLHEIKNRIDSVRGTKKITRAMYLISASKSQKAKQQLQNTKPFFDQVALAMSEILGARGVEAIDTPYLRPPAKSGGKFGQGRTLCVVLAGDKGMAGGYGHNIMNLLSEKVPVENSVILVAGILGRNQVRRLGYQIEDSFRQPVMNPSVFRAREVAEIVMASYLSGEYASVNIIYTEMLTPLSQVPTFAQLLPLDAAKLVGAAPATAQMSPATKYEPSAPAVFERLVTHYLKGVIYGAFVEAFTSEQHARMYAMDNATKSADDMIATLSVRYNRARQAVITQEISEIVSGIPTD